MKIKTLPIVLCIALLAGGCVKRAEFDASQRQLSIAHDQIAQLQQQNGKLQKDVDAQAAKLSDVQTQIAELERKSDQQTSPESHETPTELKIESEVTQEIGQRLNIGAGAEWFRKHEKDIGFGIVSKFTLDLGDLRDHSTRARLLLINENGDSTDLLVEAEMASLYEKDPESGLWVAKFWRKKALIANQVYLDQLIARYSKQSASPDTPGVDSSGLTAEQEQKLSEETELVLTTYYYDHWKEIKDMIFASLVTNAVQQNMNKK
jgi:hypothetical protein